MVSIIPVETEPWTSSSLITEILGLAKMSSSSKGILFQGAEEL